MSTGNVEGNPESVPRAAAAAGRVSPADLVAFLPYACRELQVRLAVRVHVRAQEEYVSRGSKRRSKLHRASANAPASSPTGLASSAASDDLSPDPPRTFPLVPVTATLDAAGRVLELELTRVRVPRALLQVLALAAPYNPTLVQLALRRCRLRGHIVHELAKPAFAALTDLCLDGSPVPEANYATLLDGDRLRRLSLARVLLDDNECAELAARLHHPLPAARSLRVLDLCSNAVGDAGAVALARALRSNRTLLHLNLAGNRVGDDGATELLRALTPFPLTGPEVHESRRRRVAHLRSVRASKAAPRVGERGRRGTSPASGRGVAPRRTSRTGSIPDEIEARAATLAGSFEDPFAPSETVCVAGHTYCIGNRVLCYLNLAHNWLTALTAGQMARALEAQRVTRRTSLLRVVLDGNPLPSAKESVHMAHVEKLLDCAVSAAARLEVPARRSVRSRSGR